MCGENGPEFCVVKTTGVDEGCKTDYGLNMHFMYCNAAMYLSSPSSCALFYDIGDQFMSFVPVSSPLNVLSHAMTKEL